MAKRWALLVLAGAVLGTLGDQIHVRFHVLSYPHPAPWLFGQAWWVPVLFAAVAPVLVAGYATLSRLLPDEDHRDRETLTPAGLVVPALLFYAAYAATGLFQDSPHALTAGLVVAWIARVAVRPRRVVIAHSLACAIAGPAFEAALSSTGAFSYAHPDAIVPLWLPALYLHLAPAVRHLYLVFFAAGADEPRPHVTPAA